MKPPVGGEKKSMRREREGQLRRFVRSLSNDTRARSQTHQDSHSHHSNPYAEVRANSLPSAAVVAAEVSVPAG